MVTSPIGGFMPIPLAMMIPFMAAQSMVMGDAFGRAFQHGKRKISAMTNEEFNKTNLPQMMEEIITDYKQIIPSLQQGIKDSTTLQTTIVSEMLQLLPKLVTGLVTEVADNLKTNEPVIQEQPNAPPISLREQRIIDANIAAGQPTTPNTSRRQNIAQTLALAQLNQAQRLLEIQLQNLTTAPKGGSAYSRLVVRARKLTVTRDITLKKYISKYGKPWSGFTKDGKKLIFKAK